MKTPTAHQTISAMSLLLGALLLPGDTTRAAQIQCGPGYYSPGESRCCNCGGAHPIRVRCGNTDHCCAGSSMCQGASMFSGTLCDENCFMKDTRFDFSLRACTANLETATMLSAAGAVNEPFHIKAGVRQPSLAPDAVIAMYDAGGRPLVMNGTAVTFAPVCGASGQLVAATACEPDVLQPPQRGERWIQFASQQAIPSDPNGNSTSYQFVATWVEPDDAVQVLNALDGKTVGGWVSTDQDDLYALPAQDIFSSAVMSLVSMNSIPAVGAAGLVMLMVALAGLGVAVILRR